MYETLASLYDLYMEETPYEKWSEKISLYLKKYNKNPKTVLDLGCGTGTMSIKLKDKGYEVTGLDISPEMLTVAADKAAESEHSDILFVCQDMRELEVPKPFDLIVSLCDCFNYITDERDLMQVFKNCHESLNEGGMLIFDINSRYKLKEILGSSSFCQTEDSSAFTCENFYDETDNICQYYVNFFIEEEDGSYSRYDEEHFERAYTVEEISALLESASFTLYEIADADTLGKVTDTTERIYFIAGKE